MSPGFCSSPGRSASVKIGLSSSATRYGIALFSSSGDPLLPVLCQTGTAAQLAPQNGERRSPYARARRFSLMRSRKPVNWPHRSIPSGSQNSENARMRGRISPGPEAAGFLLGNAAHGKHLAGLSPTVRSVARIRNALSRSVYRRTLPRPRTVPREPWNGGQVGFFQEQWQTRRMISRTLAGFFTICRKERRFRLSYQRGIFTNSVNLQ
jgi:hypothetical protein